MTDKTLQLNQVKKLFDKCEPLSSNERALLLNNSSYPSDVISQVTRLLTFSDQQCEGQNSQQDYIQQEFIELSQGFIGHQKLGAYQLDQEIGRGGMGIVFKAQRADGQYEQQVAIKILPSLASEEDLSRFQQERQILAELQHANIATLLDGGISPDGRPYLVMEYIDGQTITDYCQQNNLGLTERLELFRQICHTVSFAHSRLIIHRDLKPENILVTQSGEIKLLDFGVSKILAQSIANKKQDNTTRHHNLSLNYASPEQIRGKECTTVTDVYALGVILYNLLCDSGPYQLSNNNPEEIIQHVCLIAPIAPSKLLAKNNSELVWAKQLCGDLDNIIAKALAKEPERRYASVNEFEQDVQRYLTGLPVQASPDSFSYRLTKFVKRYPLASVLSSALALSLVAGLTTSLYLTNALTKERDQLLITQNALKQQVLTSESVINLLTDIFEQSSPDSARNRAIPVTELLQNAVDETQHNLNYAPEVKARLLSSLASIYGKLGEYKNQLALIEQVILLKATLSNNFSFVDQIALSDTYNRLGQYGQAKAVLDSISEQQNKGKVINKQEHAKLDKVWAYYYRDTGQLEKSLPFFQSAYRYWLQTGSTSDDSITATYDLASIYREQRQHPKTVELLEQALADTRTLYGNENYRNARLLSTIAASYEILNQYQKALSSAEQAYLLNKKFLNPSATSYNQSVSNYVYALHSAGQYQQAIDVLQAELAIEADDKRSHGFYLTDLAIMQASQGDFHSANNSAQASKSILEPIYQDNFVYLFNTHLYLGISEIFTGQLTKAQTTLDYTLVQTKKIWGEEDYALGEILLARTHLAIANKEFSQAQQLIEQVKSIYAPFFPEPHHAYISVYRTELALNIATENWQEAQVALNNTRSLLAERHSKDSTLLAELALKQGQIYLNTEQPEQAQELINKYGNYLLKVLPETSLPYQLANSLLTEIELLEVAD